MKLLLIRGRSIKNPKNTKFLESIKVIFSGFGKLFHFQQTVVVILGGSYVKVSVLGSWLQGETSRKQKQSLQRGKRKAVF